MAEARRLILRPLVTEKSVANTARSQYCFEVHADASKHQIRAAVEQIFKVRVLGVNTNMLPKVAKRDLRRRRAKQPVITKGTWKKAIVTVRAGDKIEVGGVNYFES